MSREHSQQSASAAFITVAGVAVPTFLYGTAWKEDETERLTALALAKGFRGIDTANQRRHYHEAGVGAALRTAFRDGTIQREELFLQSKFTYERGQDHRLPYDPAADLATQVQQSFASSLQHLHTDYLDSYVLHGPATGDGINGDDMQVWQAMEALRDAGQTRLLGISNVSAEQLRSLCQQARHRPAFVQNRCYARHGWDRDVRAVCREFGVVYQGFSLLTANRDEIRSPEAVTLRQRLGCTSAQMIYCFARHLGMIRLNGTSDAEHMREDMHSDDVVLSPDDIALLERISG